MDINNDKNPVVEVFSGTLWEAEMIKSLLFDSGINSFLKNNVLNTYLYEPGFSEGVKVMVMSSDHEEAGKVVAEYYSNLDCGDSSSG